jgi:hypothetical protein
VGRAKVCFLSHATLEDFIAKSVLIIGQDPALVDFSAPGAPPGTNAEKVMSGLKGSRDRLRSMGHEAGILLTKDPETVAAQVSEALEGRNYDVIVVGRPPDVAADGRALREAHQRAARARATLEAVVQLTAR